MNEIEQSLQTLPRISTPLNQNEGTRAFSPQLLDINNSQLNTQLFTSFHTLEPSMGQRLLKEVSHLKELPNFSGEGEYDNMKFITGIEIIKEDFELPERFLTARSKVETSFESVKFDAEKDKALTCFFQQKDRLTALYPDISEFIIHRKVLRQCGGDLENAVKCRTTEKYSEEDIINILEEVTSRARIGSSRVNLKTKFNTPWKDSADNNTKESSDIMKYKSADKIRKCHIFQRTTHLANECTKRGRINETSIKKEPYVEKK
ncbi:hypothetical protein O181_008039 [Austropuccinia psidii MF-1]|uniref:Uncharacterized protein n=1 Tax=Austropuccinia psidii MF-1 TaxID=1389203 RepID=A0A9Q3GIH0_9BASI|nr:hypothetical protein [Austropuccinia psidii MF-1]